MTSPIALSLFVTLLGVWQLRGLRHLHAGSAAPPTRTVSVIVPARDEAGSLPLLLASIACQERRPDEVIVVDDGSTDDTGARAAAAGASVLSASGRPDGWMGKPWACRTGAAASSGDILIFLDADVTLGTRAIERLIHTHHEVGGGLLSVQPHHVAPRWWEQASAFPNLISVLATGALRPTSAGPPVAFGPCLVTDRADYEAAGTHEAVAGEVIEDIHLARAYARCGLPVTCCIGGGDVRFRMYPDGPGQLVEGWTKNLAGGPALAVGWPLAIGLLWLLGVSSLVGTIVTGALAGDGRVVAPWLLVSAGIGWMLSRIGSFRWWAPLTFPLLWLAFVALFARSAIARARGTATWRGRRLAMDGP